jgi:hypothetical protein
LSYSTIWAFKATIYNNSNIYRYKNDYSIDHSNYSDHFFYQYENLSNYNHNTIEKLKYILNYDSVNYNEIYKLEKRVYYKPNNTYWEKLEPFIYFKLSLSYYFIDKYYGKVVFLTHEQNKLNFTVRLYIYKKDYLILKNQIETPRIEMEIYKKFILYIWISKRTLLNQNVLTLIIIQMIIKWKYS